MSSTTIYNNNSVKRVFTIIETLVSYPNGCPLSLLARETKLSKSTVHRFLNTLIQLGYVTNAVIENNYKLTFKIANIGQKLIHETNIVQLALLDLTRLKNITQETINLKFFQQDHSVLLFKLEPNSGNFRTRTYMGQSLPLFCTATGKVFLAYRDETFVKNYWKKQQHNIKAITRTTITKLPAFLKCIQKVRTVGYAIDMEENELGIACVAAPVFDIHGEVNYSISIAMQKEKLKTNNLKQYIAPLLESAQNLSRELGFNKDITIQ